MGHENLHSKNRLINSSMLIDSNWKWNLIARYFANIGFMFDDNWMCWTIFEWRDRFIGNYSGWNFHSLFISWCASLSDLHTVFSDGLFRVGEGGGVSVEFWKRISQNFHGKMGGFSKLWRSTSHLKNPSSKPK